MTKTREARNSATPQTSNNDGCLKRIAIGVVVAVIAGGVLMFIEPIRDKVAPKFIKKLFDDREELVLHPTGIGPITVGMSVDSLKVKLKEYDFIVKNYEGTMDSDDTPAMYVEDVNGNILFSALINYEMRVVLNLIIKSDKFKSQSKIHTGMSIKDYTQIYENAQLLYVNNPDEYYEGFFPVDMQTDSTDFVAIVGGYAQSEDDMVGSDYSEVDSVLLTSAKTVNAAIAVEYDELAKIQEFLITKHFKDPYEQ